MGANDAQEMLDAAKSECVRLERENSELRKQLAKAWAEIERRPEPAFRDALIADRNKAESALAEAQATIEKVCSSAQAGLAECDDDCDMSALWVLETLSAPSSTGGNTEWVDPEPWWYPNSRMRTGHKLAQTTGEYRPRTREQFEKEFNAATGRGRGGNDHE